MKGRRRGVAEVNYITKTVTPAKAGVQGFYAPAVLATLDSGVRRDDENFWVRNGVGK